MLTNIYLHLVHFTFYFYLNFLLEHQANFFDRPLICLCISIFFICQTKMTEKFETFFLLSNSNKSGNFLFLNIRNLPVRYILTCVTLKTVLCTHFIYFFLANLVWYFVSKIERIFPKQFTDRCK